jgi:GntR family histidine utilization transcriptional repressor
VSEEAERDGAAGDGPAKGRPDVRGWEDAAAEARRRITFQEWPPGSTIPAETELARDWGVSRATVNRALQALAEEGLLDRRRRAGTKVADRPSRPASFEVGLIRDEVRALGKRYRYELVEAQLGPTPDYVRERMMMSRTSGAHVVRVLARHLAGGEPYAWEERYIHGGTVPEALKVDWKRNSPNDWLLANVPYSRVEVALGATLAGPMSAKALGCDLDDALLTLERVTWRAVWPVTFVSFAYPPGHRIWSRT